MAAFHNLISGFYLVDVQERVFGFSVGRHGRSVLRRRGFGGEPAEGFLSLSMLKRAAASAIFHLLQNFRETVERQLGRFEAPISESQSKREVVRRRRRLPHDRIVHLTRSPRSV